jgi:hypothetical protein
MTAKAYASMTNYQNDTTDRFFYSTKFGRCNFLHYFFLLQPFIIFILTNIYFPINKQYRNIQLLL